ncbi:MAG: heparinase II/III family protein, partial [Candidatus Glassbacteria bacterium]|nr:heparinase II/III family protein [Candidatus Glassbacteria bacterium]
MPTAGANTLGDLNDDGEVNVFDLLEFLRITGGAQAPTEKQKLLGDTRGDGSLDTEDLRDILRHLDTGEALPPYQGEGVFALRDHPRLLISGEELKTLRRKVRTSLKEPFDRMKSSATRYLRYSPAVSSKKEMRGMVVTMPFIYLMTGDSLFLKGGVRYLDYALDYLLELTAEQFAGYWEIVELRRNTAFAYDWLFKGMTAEERAGLGEKIIRAGDAFSDIYNSYSPFGGGGYGGLDILFYPALALAGSAVQPGKVESWYRWSEETLKIYKSAKSQVAADDGGVEAGMGYAAYNYIRTHIFDFEMWLGATGENLLEDNYYLRYFPVWWAWCLRPNGELSKVCDLQSVEGGVPLWHFKYLAARYRDPLSQWYVANQSGSAAPEVWDLIWDTSDAGLEPSGPDSTWPLARHFEGTGWVAMRSGWDEDATHAIFKCGDYCYGHEHADQNSFVIFKQGSLAIESGRYEWESDHRPNYFARTIAHNTVLVYDPEE